MNEEEELFLQYTARERVSPLQPKDTALSTGETISSSKLDSIIPLSSAKKKFNKERFRKLHKKPIPKKIRRGFNPDDKLDLHGETIETALTLTQAFIQSCYQKRMHSILIITGKGRHSKENAFTLQKVVWNWITNNDKNFVRSFDWAPSFLGGEGAILLFLK